MSNYPDDWDTYWSTCAVCGDRSHASAPEPCACYENAAWLDEVEAPDDEDEEVVTATPLTLLETLQILHELLARDTAGLVTRVTLAGGANAYVTLNNDEAFGFLVSQGAEPSKWYGAELSQRHAELTFLGLEVTAYEIRL